MLTRSFLCTDMAKFPKNTVNPNPYKKYPKFVQVARELPNPLRNAGDLQKGTYALWCVLSLSIVRRSDGACCQSSIGPMATPVCTSAMQPGHGVRGVSGRWHLPSGGDVSPEWRSCVMVTGNEVGSGGAGDRPLFAPFARLLCSLPSRIALRQPLVGDNS